MARLRRHFSIHGTVQGVGFRWALRSQALALNLDGWVRNRRDGSVEALACGAPEALAALTDWVHQGPPSAHVDRVTYNDAPDDGLSIPPGFEQKSSL